MGQIVSSYTGVWRPGTGEQRWFTGSPAAFAAADAGFFKQGLRLVAIDRHNGNVGLAGAIGFQYEDRLAGVWHAGTGAQYWSTGLSAADFKATDAKHVADGLRLTAIDTCDGTFTGVWRPGTGTQYWASGLSADEFKAKDDAYFAQGLRMVAIDIDVTGKFCAVWRTGTGVQRWFSGPTAVFKDTNIQFLNEGLRLTAIDHNGGHFAGVWHAGTGAEYWFTGLTADAFKQKDAELFAEGLRMVAIDVGTVEAPAAPPPPQPVVTSRHLVLKEKAPYSGAGGNATWMDYTFNVADSDADKSKTVTSVENPNAFEIILTHGPSAGVPAQIGLPAHSTSRSSTARIKFSATGPRCSLPWRARRRRPRSRST
ncbi:MAG TPA: hypothetical protein VN706_02435 [Gemmatimonadaceae bacterium]|nr:hypothetical protein [Gemmatimonadaceae bacterium]